MIQKFGVVLKTMNYFYSVRIHLINKNQFESKYIYYKTFPFQTNTALFNFLPPQKILKNMYHGFQKNIKQQKQFSTLIIRTIINNWALSQQYITC